MKAQQKRVVFDSDDSSASDNEGHEHGGDKLAREMAAAVERERRKNPHAETGRAKVPRTHPLAPPAAAASSSTSTSTPAQTSAAPYTAQKKMDLFFSDSSSNEEEEEEQGEGEAKKASSARAGASQKESSKHAALMSPLSASSSSPSGSGTKVAHVQGLSLRAVKQRSNVGDEAEDEERDVDVLHINRAFATRYEEQKRKQELHTLAEKYKGKLGRLAAAIRDSDSNDDDEEEDEEDEDDAEEDEDAVLLTQENNLSFAKALLAVRKATVTQPQSQQPLLPKEELLKDRFFPPAEEQIRVNTDIFERYVDRKRHVGSGSDAPRFTLSDEYARALKATADSEDAVVESAEGSERDGLRKLRPQNAAEAKLRAAFLRDVEDSASTFEVVKGAKSSTAGRDDEGDEGGVTAAELRRLQAARGEEKRLLEEAFSLGKTPASTGSDSEKKGVATAAAACDAEPAEEGKAASENEKEDDDAFLRDFFIQELWRPGTSSKKSKKAKTAGVKASADAKKGDGNNSDDGADDDDDDGNGGSYYDRLAQLAREEEDEAFFNDAEVWEREYQEKKYRHQEAEEAAAAHVQTFPRPIGEAAVGLLRKPDTSRKDARQRRRERAEAAHAQQVEELKRLKHLKRKEIEDQRALIASVAGLTVGSRRSRTDGPAIGALAGDADAAEEAELAKLKAVWSDKDLDAPFDPAEFDRKMAQLFDDDYYDEKNVDDDEIAYFDEELDKDNGDGDNNDADLAAIRSGAAPALFAANSLEDARAMLPAPSLSSSKGEKKSKQSGELFFDDAFGPQHGGDGSSYDALNLLYPSEALQALEKERQQLNDLLASAQQQTNGESNEELLARLQASLKKKEEEYYELHRDATADGAGGGPAFRYREVEPEDFTLSVEEILALDDRQLNMIAPMNCYAAYLDKDSNERDRRRIERRRQRGFREVASDRTSRRYGDVGNTVLLNPEQISEEEGAAIAERLAKRLRDDGEDPEAPLETPSSRPQRPFRGPRREEDPNRGCGRGRGGFRGGGGGGFRGGRGRGGDGGRGGFRGGRRGGR